MAPVVYSEDDTTMVQKELFFEASVLHKIPPELLVQSSSSTSYLQSFPNGKINRNWLSSRRKDRKTDRLRRLARFHAELLGRSIESERPSSGEKKITSEELNNKENVDADRNSVVDENELLLDITLRTMVLLHHNQQLQNKLTALQIETKNFMRSYHKDDGDNSVLVKSESGAEDNVNDPEYKNDC